VTWRGVTASAATAASLIVAALPAAAQTGMPDLRQMSGVPLPANDLPAGSVSVRVVRGTFANNLADVAVDFIVAGGATSRKTTGADGRAVIEGLRPGSRVRAVAVVGGERLESQEVTIAATGIRFVLVATGEAAGAAAATTPSASAAPGSVVIGSDSRVIAEFSNDRLNVFYILHVLNSSAAPADIGGPLVFELPQGARGTTVMDDSTPAASANGPRVTVTGPFAAGVTNVNIAFELPYDGAVATLEQAWPVAAPRLAIFALRVGELDLESAQLATKQAVVQQGQPLVAGMISPLTAGEPLVVRLTGLPHHPRWPRDVALGAAGLILIVGLWAAFFPTTRHSRRA
jgi:hypothetical protein